MGKINTKNGQLSGSIGHLVYATWKGKPYVRSKPMRDYSKQSDKQKSNRSRFGIAAEFIGKILPYIRIGYRMDTVDKSAYNAAVGYVTKYGIKGEKGSYELDYENIHVSRGVLCPPKIAKVLVEDNILAFTWENNAGMGDAKSDDRAIPLVFNTRIQQGLYDLEILTLRSDECVNVELPESWRNDTCVAYLAFVSLQDNNVSNSLYFELNPK